MYFKLILEICQELCLREKWSTDGGRVLGSSLPCKYRSSLVSSKYSNDVMFWSIFRLSTQPCRRTCVGRRLVTFSGRTLRVWKRCWLNGRWRVPAGWISNTCVSAWLHISLVDGYILYFSFKVNTYKCQLCTCTSWVFYKMYCTRTCTWVLLTYYVHVYL